MRIVISQTRNYGIDLLRMLSMFMICMLHILGHGGVLSSVGQYSSQKAIANFLYFAANCAVNCFALISGYVGLTAKFKYRNLFSLWKQVVFYSVSITLIFHFAMPESVGVKQLIFACFPISTGAYWYFTAYALMFFFIPQMNFILENQEKEILKSFLITLFIIFSACSCLPIISYFTVPVAHGFSAIWLAYLYIVGGFIRKYSAYELFSFNDEHVAGLKYYTNKLMANVFKGGRRWALAFYFACIFVTWFSCTVLHSVAIHFIGRDPVFTRLQYYNSPTIFMAGIALLHFFHSLDVERISRFIHFWSPLAFGVYLIHDQNQVRAFLIKNAFSWIATLDPILLSSVVIAVAFSIYVGCSCIEYLRCKIFKFLHLQ